MLGEGGFFEVVVLDGRVNVMFHKVKCGDIYNQFSRCSTARASRSLV